MSGFHNVQPGQKCRILTIQIAVPADTDPSIVADEMTSLLTTSIATEGSSVLDWQYVPGCGPDDETDENFIFAGNNPKEGEIFSYSGPRLLLAANALLRTGEIRCKTCGDGSNDEMPEHPCAHVHAHRMAAEIKAAQAGYDMMGLPGILAEIGQDVVKDEPDHYAHLNRLVEIARRMMAHGGYSLDNAFPGGHTPGTWLVEADEELAGRHPFHDHRFITSGYAGGVTICKMMDSPRMGHDGRLIAAAPAMKAMLETCYRYLAVMVAENIQTGVRPSTVMKRIDALMAEIEGAK